MQIEKDHLNLSVQQLFNRPNNSGSNNVSFDKNNIISEGLYNYLEKLEKKVYLSLVSGESDIVELSKRLGVPKSSFYKKLKTLNITLNKKFEPNDILT
ncbi:MAG: helix-turn-helix domain-containing protein [Pseudomonadota bacterium]